MPRIVIVILVCGLIAMLVNLLLPIPHPWGLLLNIALAVWVIIEVLAMLPSRG